MFATLQTAASIVGHDGIGPVARIEDVPASPQLASAMTLLGKCWQSVLRYCAETHHSLNLMIHNRTITGCRTAGFGFGWLDKTHFEVVTQDDGGIELDDTEKLGGVQFQGFLVGTFGLSLNKDGKTDGIFLDGIAPPTAFACYRREKGKEFREQAAASAQHSLTFPVCRLTGAPVVRQHPELGWRERIKLLQDNFEKLSMVRLPLPHFSSSFWVSSHPPPPRLNHQAEKAPYEAKAKALADLPVCHASEEQLRPGSGPASLEGLSLKELKQELQRLDVSTANLLEKSEFVAALAAAQPAAAASQHPAFSERYFG